MSEWQEAMVWTSKESVGIFEGSDTLSFGEHNIIGSTVGLEKLDIQANSLWGWLTLSFCDHDDGVFLSDIL